MREIGTMNDVSVPDRPAFRMTLRAFSVSNREFAYTACSIVNEAWNRDGSQRRTSSNDELGCIVPEVVRIDDDLVALNLVFT